MTLKKQSFKLIFTLLYDGMEISVKNTSKIIRTLSKMY